MRVLRRPWFIEHEHTHRMGTCARGALCSRLFGSGGLRGSPLHTAACMIGVAVVLGRPSKGWVRRQQEFPWDQCVKLGVYCTCLTELLGFEEERVVCLTQPWGLTRTSPLSLQVQILKRSPVSGSIPGLRSSNNQTLPSSRDDLVSGSSKQRPAARRPRPCQHCCSAPRALGVQLATCLSPSRSPRPAMSFSPKQHPTPLHSHNASSK